MKPFPFFSSVLAVSLAIASLGAFVEALAHVGHGDEF